MREDLATQLSISLVYSITSGVTPVSLTSLRPPASGHTLGREAYVLNHLFHTTELKHLLVFVYCYQRTGNHYALATALLNNNLGVLSLFRT